MNENSLKSALGLSVSVIATEHFMSAGLSSPWSTRKFAQTEEDKKEVWFFFREAAVASLIFGAVVGYMLKSIWPLIGSILTVVYYYKLYEKALNGEKL